MPLTEEDICCRYVGATAALERGDVESARKDFERILLDLPKFAAAWDGLGRCFDAEGDLKRAGEAYRKAVRCDRQNWRSRYNWAVALHRAGELREAIRFLRSAVRIAQGERCLHHRLGRCFADLGEYEEALRCYRTALEQPEKEVSDTELYVQIGNAECERGDFEAADRAYERACLFTPDDPDVYYQWAVVTARFGDLDNARRLAARARALDPRSLRYRLFLVNLAMDAGEWEDAEARIRELRLLRDTERLEQALRAALARRVGDLDAARALALDTLTMDGPPSDHAVDSALATLRELRGELRPCTGYRLMVEALTGGQAYYRPYVVLAESEEQARWFVAELQDALDPSPWRIVETETFPQDGEALAGVYHLLLTRVLFPVESGLFHAPR